MPEQMITFFGHRVKVGCDGNCAKAWGLNSRPCKDDNRDNDYLLDSELAIAPADPGTYEGPHGKPDSVDDFPNKWCVRECERSAITPHGTDPNLPLELPNYGQTDASSPE